MYGCSVDKKYLKPSRNRTRADAKTVFNLPGKCMTKFLNSPFYKENQLWDELDKNAQCCGTIDIFAKHVNPLYLSLYII